MASNTSLKRLYTKCTVLLYLPVALCHMQMNNPFPLRSPLDPQTPENFKDYNMVAPLNPSGSDFSCKGYQYNTPLRSTATYTAAETYNMSVVGGATHEGGSCQLSLSYDNGSTFKVIKSMIGGCPLTLSYNFTIPDEAPSGQALFAWTWFNHEGNREMYMNCAVVNILSSTNYLGKRVSMKALASLPDLWVANLAGINSCKTIEGTDPVFPDPGTDVVYGNGMSSADSASTAVGQCNGKSIAGGNSSSMYAAPSSPAAGMGYTTPAPYAAAPTSSEMDINMGMSYDPHSPDYPASTGDWDPSVDVNSGDRPGQNPSQGQWEDPAAGPSDEPGKFSEVAAFRIWSPTSTCIQPPDVTVTVTPSGWPTQPSGCWGNMHSCGDCWWPSSCITINHCSTMCGIRSSTLHTATQEPTITLTSIHTISEYSSTGFPTLPSSLPPPPPPPPPPHPSCTNNPPPYATGDPSAYLPCTPGTFLCTSSSNFLTCIQTNTGWAYDASRAVASGMMCLPFLSPSTSPHKARGAAAAPNPQGFPMGPGPVLPNGPIRGRPQVPNWRPETCPLVPSGFYRDDQYVRARPQGSCSPDGSVACNGPSDFSICNQGGWIDMGGVAAGTQCVNGKIVPI